MTNGELIGIIAIMKKINRKIATKKHQPIRTCVGCRILKPKHKLLRIVKKKDLTIELDPSSKASGRGAYICLNVECAKLAKKHRGFDQTFKAKIPDTFYDTLIEYFTH